jgi:hypothetical protein
MPIENIEILSVVIEEFIDTFRHGKEEKAYFPATKRKDGYSEDICKFLIEHELERQIATILRQDSFICFSYFSISKISKGVYSFFKLSCETLKRFSYYKHLLVSKIYGE